MLENQGNSLGVSSEEVPSNSIRIAHELNNALSAIRGHLELMKIYSSQGSREHQSIEAALSGCRRASNLVKDLMGRSRSSSDTDLTSPIAGHSPPDLKRLSSGTVMLIEDEAPLIELKRTFFEKAGFTVKAFLDGSEGVTWYKRHSNDTDIVILDMIMPGMDGQQCFYEIRRINPRAKVAFCTGFIKKGIEKELLEAGALRIFEKPLDYTGLVKWVISILDDEKNKIELRQKMARLNVVGMA